MKNKNLRSMNGCGMAKILAAFITLTSLFGQHRAYSQNPEPCGQALVTNAWFEKHPESKAAYDAIQAQKAALENKAKRVSSAPAYTIPLVFHIIHLGGIENISDAQVIDQVAILNRDYQKQNADTAVIVPAYTNNIANVGFAFKLATIDPDGNCTNGIVRHYNTKTNWDANNLNDFIFSWPTDRYLNIYVVKTMNINATAYAFLPGIGIPANADVIVAMHNMVGSMGTASVANSRVLTHEVAHWFDIQHIWGSSNSPGVACGDDLVNDTPITKGFSSCNTAGSNVCDPNIHENVQNYMDYSPCKIMFTNGQASRMYATIASNINNRGNVPDPANLVATGVIGSSPCTTLADFYSTKNTTCAGNTFTFTSLSQFGSTPGTLQWTFAGGTPSSSSGPVQVVSYASPGIYPVSLTATGANGTDTETKNAYVTVINGSGGIAVPLSYDFEAGTLPANLTVTNEQADTIFWKQHPTLGANSTGKCIYLHNFPDSTNYGNRDYFETPYFDFTNTSGISLSYYYAYAKRYTTQADSFKVQYSFDCGGSWVNIVGIPNMNTMAANTGGTLTTAFVPTPAQWKQVTIPSALLNALANKPSVKFRYAFKSDYYVNGSNNIYIDQINITGNIATSVSEFEKGLQLLVYPNPTNASTALELRSPSNSQMELQLCDVTGRIVKQEHFNLQEGAPFSYVVNKEEILAPGIYFINLSIEGQKITKKLVVE
jgi:PKD repeat protein